MDCVAGILIAIKAQESGPGGGVRARGANRLIDCSSIARKCMNISTAMPLFQLRSLDALTHVACYARAVVSVGGASAAA